MEKSKIVFSTRGCLGAMHLCLYLYIDSDFLGNIFGSILSQASIVACAYIDVDLLAFWAP